MKRLLVLTSLFLISIAGCEDRTCYCGYDAYGYWVCDCYNDCYDCGAYTCYDCGAVIPPTAPPPSPSAPACDLEASFEIGYNLGYEAGFNVGYCGGAPEADLGDFNCTTEYIRGYHVGCVAGIADREATEAP